MKKFKEFINEALEYTDEEIIDNLISKFGWNEKKRGMYYKWYKNADGDDEMALIELNFKSDNIKAYAFYDKTSGKTITNTISKIKNSIPYIIDKLAIEMSKGLYNKVRLQNSNNRKMNHYKRS